MPYAPRTMYTPRYSGEIMNLMLRQGDIQAQRAQQMGQTWGNAIQGLGNIAASYYGAKQDEKLSAAREQAFGAAVNSWDEKDPVGSVKRLAAVPGVGMRGALEFGGALVSLQSALDKKEKGEQPTLDELNAAIKGAAVAKNAAPGLFAQSFPAWGHNFGPAAKKFYGVDLEKASPDDVSKWLDAQAASLGKPTAAKTYEVTVPGPGGAPMKKTFTEEEMKAGVPEYVKPTEVDPMVSEMRQLRIDDLKRKAQEAADAGKAQEASIAHSVEVTPKGTSYLDLGLFKGKEAEAAKQWAAANDVKVLDHENAQALREVQNARQDLEGAYNSVKDHFSGGGLLGWAARKGKTLEAAGQFGEEGSLLKAYEDTKAEASVRLSRATSGGKGLRFSRDLIDKAMKAMPTPTADSADTAEKKMALSRGYLDNVENAILGVHAPAAGGTNDEPPDAK